MHRFVFAVARQFAKDCMIDAYFDVVFALMWLMDCFWPNCMGWTRAFAVR